MTRLSWCAGLLALATLPGLSIRADDDWALPAGPRGDWTADLGAPPPEHFIPIRVQRYNNPRLPDEDYSCAHPNHFPLELPIG